MLSAWMIDGYKPCATGPQEHRGVTLIKSTTDLANLTELSGQQQRKGRDKAVNV
jgi:hypothetical protein